VASRTPKIVKVIDVRRLTVRIALFRRDVRGRGVAVLKSSVISSLEALSVDLGF